LVCAITPISYEHTQKLGNTLKEIATEKAGIIKRQEAKGKRQELVVISAPQEREAEEVIRKRCRLVGADLYTVGKGIKYKKIKDRFSVTTPLGEYNNLKIKLLGEHQLVNATVAVAVVEALRRYNKVVGTDAVRSGLLDTLWPGRCEVIAKNPLVVLDGAQNLASAVVLKKAIRENFRYQRLIMVLGISNDKDVQGVCRQLSSLADTIVLTMANNPRATKPEAMVKYLEGRELHFTYSVEKAAETAKSLAGKNDLILVCGSLFVVGEFRNALK
jgi:dihydrofolate synthase/folylpolyglutamate synthase